MPKTKLTKRTTVSRKKPVAVPQTAELLLEIGVEELPYQFIAPALSALEQQAAFAFGFHRLSYHSIKTYGTPRRLVLVVEGLKTHQDPFTTEVIGPSKKVAFDQSGQPTKAAIMFAAGKGVPVESLQVKQMPERGEYVVAVKEDKGRPTITILCETLPKVLEELSFPKAMKWNETGVRFARPVRWVLALYGGAVLPIEAAGIKAGNKTYGHRVLGAKQGIAVRDFAGYVKALEAQGVVADPARRRAMIEEQIAALCKKTGFALNQDAALLDQAVYTTEYPNAIIGSFKELYLDVPEEILITSMKEHQGFFSLRHKTTGKLVAHFIAVANNRVKDMGLIREGNERVLAARLADAKFFFDQDREISPEDRVEKLRGITFHQRLGTVYDKMERTEKLIAFLAIDTGNQGEIDLSRRAARLANTDLVSAVVGEFPTLQGVMGGEYAKHANENPAVSKAITEQYLPRGMEGPIPDSLVGKLLSLADRLAKITGFFRVGVLPKGSEDPYALRRDALAIVRILIEGDIPLNLNHALDEARKIFEGANIFEQQLGMAQGVFDFIVERFRYYAGTAGGIKRDDVINAVLSPANIHTCTFRQLLDRMKALESVTAKPEFDPLIVGFKRAHRLVWKENWGKESVDYPQFTMGPPETKLHKQTKQCKTDYEAHIAKGHYREALDSLVNLKPAIDAFFAEVMVNAEDPALREVRLSLLKDVDEFFMSFADFSQIVVQGS